LPARDFVKQKTSYGGKKISPHETERVLKAAQYSISCHQLPDVDQNNQNHMAWKVFVQAAR